MNATHLHKTDALLPAATPTHHASPPPSGKTVAGLPSERFERWLQKIQLPPNWKRQNALKILVIGNKHWVFIQTDGRVTEDEAGTEVLGQKN